MADTENKEPAEKAKEKTEGGNTTITNNSNWLDDLIKGLSAGLGLTIQGFDYFSGAKDNRTQAQNDYALQLAQLQANKPTSNNTAMTIAIIGGIVLLAVLLLKK